MAVVSLRGGIVPQEGVPNASVIEALEEALERARSGEIQGVAIAQLHADRLASYAIAGIIGGYSLLGALEMLKSVIVRHIEAEG